jgi:SAM-dependent methyltransferase
MVEPDDGREWDGAYAGGSPPPWDIGRPQPAFVRLAEVGALSGAFLDAGCGTGEHTILAAVCGARALGIDISVRAVEEARRKAAERRVEVAFEVFDARRLDAHGPAYDTIADSGLFHVFDDADRACYVTALHAALRPGGHLHLMCFSDRQAGDWGPRRVTEDELRSAFATGWRIESLLPGRFELSVPAGASAAGASAGGTSAAEAWVVDAVRL